MFHASIFFLVPLREDQAEAAPVASVMSGMKIILYLVTISHFTLKIFATFSSVSAYLPTAAAQ